MFQAQVMSITFGGQTSPSNRHPALTNSQPEATRTMLFRTLRSMPALRTFLASSSALPQWSWPWHCPPDDQPFHRHLQGRPGRRCAPGRAGHRTRNLLRKVRGHTRMGSVGNSVAKP